MSRPQRGRANGEGTIFPRRRGRGQLRPGPSPAGQPGPRPPHHRQGDRRLPQDPRARSRHAVAALDGVDGARADWADTRGINEYKRKALELAEAISARPHRPQADPDAPSRDTRGAGPAQVAEPEAPKAEPEASI